MDIAIARQTITTLLKQRTDELAALQLASDLLNDTFKPNLDALLTAQAESNDFAQQLQAERAKGVMLQTQLDAKTLTPELDVI